MPVLSRIARNIRAACIRHWVVQGLPAVPESEPAPVNLLEGLGSFLQPGLREEVPWEHGLHVLQEASGIGLVVSSGWAVGVEDGASGVLLAPCSCSRCLADPDALDRLHQDGQDQQDGGDVEAVADGVASHILL